MKPDKSRNKKREMLKDITEAQAAEKALLKGCTVIELAVVLWCSKKKARQLIAGLTELGCVISEPVKGARVPHVYKMQKKSRVFFRYA